MDREVKVMLVGDRDTVVTPLAAAIGVDPSIEIVARSGSIDDAVADVAAHPVDVAVIDLDLGTGDDVITLIPKIVAAQPTVKVIVLTERRDDWTLARSIDAGCHGYLLHDQAAADLVAAIHSIRRGEAVFAPALLGRALRLLRPDLVPRNKALTGREVEVLQLLADGRSTEAIADQLFLSVNTIRNHIHQILRKLDVRSRAAAVTAAARSGVVRVP